MITSNEVKVLDKNAEFFGTPQEQLMENAGKHLALFIEENFANPSVLLFCGMGNNGGDGFVAARYLANKNPVTLFLVGEENKIKTSIARMNFTKLKKLPLKIYDRRSLSQIDLLINNATIIIDAMLGIGLSGALRHPYDGIVEKINNTKNKIIIACDVPTGIGLSSPIIADHTITFHDKKEDMNKNVCGKIHIKDIGIPRKASLYVGPGELSVYYPRPRIDTHKGENGRILIIGGGPYTGAPALSALSALRTGADLVTIATPKDIVSTVASYSPNLIVKALHSKKHLSINDIKLVKNLCSTVDAVLIGPGLGVSTETKEAIQIIVEFLAKNKKSLVIDADGINAIAQRHKSITQSNTVITPHSMEFYNLTNEHLKTNLADRIKQVENWAKRLQIGIFVKGPIDILSDGTTTRLNIIHNESMTVGGTGDVLAGIIVALLSKKTSLINSMRIAAFTNGEAGNQAFKKLSYSICATDVIDNISTVLKKYL